MRTEKTSSTSWTNRIGKRQDKSVRIDCRFLFLPRVPAAVDSGGVTLEARQAGTRMSPWRTSTCRSLIGAAPEPMPRDEPVDRPQGKPEMRPEVGAREPDRGVHRHFGRRVGRSLSTWPDGAHRLAPHFLFAARRAGTHHAMHVKVNAARAVHRHGDVFQPLRGGKRPERLGGTGRLCDGGSRIWTSSRRSPVTRPTVTRYGRTRNLSKSHADLALVDAQEHPLRVDIADPQAAEFARPKPRGIGRHQQGPVLAIGGDAEQPHQLVVVEELGQDRRRLGARQVEVRLGQTKRDAVEEADAVAGAVAALPGQPPLIVKEDERRPWRAADGSESYPSFSSL